MATKTIKTNKPRRSEPRWPVILAILAVGGLYLALPEPLTPGPNWLLLAILAVLHVPTIVSYRLGKTELNRWLGVTLSSLTTLFLIWSLGLLIAGLPSHQQSPTALLRSASALWISTVLVFATWYWRLDAGGPNERVLRDAHTEGAFLFPQMIPGAKRS